MSTTPEPLPSIPPSPTPTDDIAHAWHDDPEDEPEPASSQSRDRLAAPSAARKGKKRDVSGERRGTGDASDEEEEVNGATAGYPPTKEEEAESRRIEENLRRWEVAERQRRKAARESVASTSGGSTAPSLLAGLFRRDSRKTPLGGVGTHHVLRDADPDAEPDADPNGNAVPLSDIHTRTPTSAAFSAPPTPDPEHATENPFDTPAASRTSLNLSAHSAIMTESESVPADFADIPRAPGPTRPTLEASSSFAAPGAGKQKQKKKEPPPPPKPIDVPAPREPPPRTATPQAGKPPEPVPPLQPVPPPSEPEPEPVDPGPPVRWWHEWLCGCGEGADRGGDHQAGRTNPFE